MTNCNEQLYFFSKEHYTYINQVFGDETVREIISEIFPNPKYMFDVEETGEDFENSYHHILRDKTKNINNVVCSVNSGYQNINIHKNDTLCQSYSLLTYFNIPIDPDQKQRQMDMIHMYRMILANKQFINTLTKEVIHKGNRTLWKDYNNAKFIPMNKTIYIKINSVLDKWQNYGYLYFIGDGTCPAESSKRQRNFGGKKIKKTIKVRIYSKK